MIATRLDEILSDYTRVGRRQEQAERERDDLCQDLEAIMAARESPQTGEEQQSRVRPTALQ